MVSPTEREMSKKKKSFSVELKKLVVSEVESGVLSLAAASRKFQVSAASITSWRKKLREGNLVENPSNREKQLEKEVQELKEKVGELVMEIDLLKKVEAYTQRLRSADSSTITGLNWRRFRRDAK